MAEDKKPLGGKGISDLIALMEANNKSTNKIANDGQNTRRHLLEMKNMQKVMNDFQARTVYGFENFQDMIDSNKLQGQEDQMERMTIFEEIRDELRKLPKETANQTVAAESKGGIAGKLGGLLSGVGIAGAGLGIGLAAVFYTAPKLIETFENMNVDKISENVQKLVGINKDVEEAGGNLLVDGGTLALALGGIGIGLAAFGIGAGVAGVVDKFLEEGWTDRIKENVLSLIAINDEVGGAGAMLAEGGALALALGGIGIGLAAFGFGSAAGGIGEAVAKFSSGEDWATKIKNNVETLLSIDQLGFWDTAGLVATLTGLGVGLAAFAVGKGAAGVADAVGKFSAGDNFGADIKAEVESLLSIGSLPNLGWDTAAFIGTMGGITAGLLAFSTAKGAAGAADALTMFTAGDNFAEDIKREVETLLTIGQEADPVQIETAMTALASLGAGLAAFAGGKGLNAIADLGASVISFFTGTKNPIDQAIELGNNAASVQAGADAFDDFATALGKFSNVNVDFDAQKFAEDLQAATKVLELAIVGGSTGGLFGFGATEFVGLKNFQGDIDTAAASITRLRDSLALTSGSVTVSAENSSSGMMVDTLSAENAILKLPDSQGGGMIAVSNQGGTNVRGGDQIFIAQSNPDIIEQSVQSNR